MYRDDRNALLARADALQKELDDAEREGAEQEGELTAANEKLAAQQKELAKLRKRLAKLEPKDQDAVARRRRTMLVAGGALSAMMIAGIVGFALMSKGADAPEPEPPRVAHVAEPPPRPPPCNPREVEPALEPEMISLHSCYQQYKAAYRGAVNADWVIGASGRASNVELSEDVPVYLHQCVRDTIIRPTYTARGCSARRTFVFEPTCPTEGACGVGETAPVCCAEYALPEEPDPAELRREIRRRMRDIAACSEQHEAPESLTISIEVRPDGAIGPISTMSSSTRISVSGKTTVDVSGGVNVTVDGKPIANSSMASIDLLTCISVALAAARFPPSRKGTTVEQKLQFGKQ